MVLGADTFGTRMDFSVRTIKSVFPPGADCISGAAARSALTCRSSFRSWSSTSIRRLLLAIVSPLVFSATCAPQKVLPTRNRDPVTFCNVSS